MEVETQQPAEQKPIQPDGEDLIRQLASESDVAQVEVNRLREAQPQALKHLLGFVFRTNGEKK
jgi:hypothetical protein